jgi:hypothetical protein
LINSPAHSATRRTLRRMASFLQVSESTFGKADVTSLRSLTSKQHQPPKAPAFDNCLHLNVKPP